MYVHIHTYIHTYMHTCIHTNALLYYKTGASSSQKHDVNDIASAYIRTVSRTVTRSLNRLRLAAGYAGGYALCVDFPTFSGSVTGVTNFLPKLFYLSK